jgi:hypothetical protein
VTSIKQDLSYKKIIRDGTWIQKHDDWKVRQQRT